MNQNFVGLFYNRLFFPSRLFQVVELIDDVLALANLVSDFFFKKKILNLFFEIIDVPSS